MAAHRHSSPSTALIHLRKPDKTQFPSTFNTLRLLSPPWMTSHFTMINSSVSLPSTLDEEPSTTTALPILELINYHSSAPWKLKPQSSNGEDFILELLNGPTTEELAMEMYEKAREECGFRPRSQIFFNTLLVRVVKSRKWELMHLILNDLRRFRVFPDCATCVWLMNACVRARKFKAVDLILKEAFGFTEGEDLASPALEAAMKGYNKLHMYSSSVAAFELLMTMRKSFSFAAVLDPGGFSLIMEAYMKLGKSRKVLELFSEIKSNGKLEALSNPTKVYEILIEALGKSGEPFKAVDYLRDMKLKEIPLSPSIYSSLITSMAKLQEIEAAEELTEEGRRNRMLKDPAMFLQLVLMYVKGGLIDRTIDVVETMKDSNIRVSDCIFCAIINGFAKQRGLKSAIEVYNELLSRGVVPGQVSLASILNVYFRLGLHSEAELVFAEMENRGFDKCVVAYSTMIAMYGKMGKLAEAMKLVAKMKSKGCEPNVWVYNSLIEMQGRVKNIRQVEKIWKEMKRRRVMADRVSYTSLISAYTKAREYEKCVEAYREFLMNGGVVDGAMAGIMVGVLSKVGRVDELMGMLQDMKAEGTKMDERLCRSALNALRDAGLRVQMSWLEESLGSAAKELRKPIDSLRVRSLAKDTKERSY